MKDERANFAEQLSTLRSHGRAGCGWNAAGRWEAGEAAPRPLPADPDEFERFSAALANPRRTDAAVVTYLARLLAEQRRAEDTLGARRLLGPVLAQLKVIDGLVRQARNPVRGALLEVLAHYEEFAGWMYQDTTDTPGALRHYDAVMEPPRRSATLT